MSLPGDEAYLSMIPNTAENKPSYSISNPSTYTITFEHTKVPSYTTDSTYIYRMLSGSGTASSNTTLSSIISNYNDNSYINKNYTELWRYGRFENDKWIFPLTYTTTGQYIAYSSLFGKMKPDNSGKWDYEFDFGTITYYRVSSTPTYEGSSSTTNLYLYTNQDGAQKLKELALGTYWQYINP